MYACSNTVKAKWNKKPLEQIKNVMNVAGYRQVSLWKREDLQHPQPDELAEEVPVALVYNGISHVVMMASPKDIEQFAVGFSLSEGIIEHRREIFGMDVVAVCNGLEVQIEPLQPAFYGPQSPASRAGRAHRLRRMRRRAAQ